MDAAYTGAQITAHRKAKGMTQKQLAEKLFVTDKAVSKWERGVNFPDLGLLEALASALDTTPASLLGLEQADQEQIVTAMTQISTDQLEQAHRDIRITGWISMAAAAAVILAYNLFGQDTARTQLAYQVLHALSFGFLGWGGHTLLRYGEIRKWETMDWLLCYGFGFPVIFYLGFQFFIGNAPPSILAMALIAVASTCIQLLFCRIMVPGFAKALPALISVGFAIWHALDGVLSLLFALPAICCTVVWLCFRIRQGCLFPAKRILLVLLVCLIAAPVLFPQPLTRLYVRCFHAHLESWSEVRLAEGTKSDRYGLWKVSVYPDAQMVEFRTGGSGLTFNSTYEGFYYSGMDIPLPFQNTDLPLEIQGNSASWTDGTDNHGQTYRFLENWFWYEAHF